MLRRTFLKLTAALAALAGIAPAATASAPVARGRKMVDPDPQYVMLHVASGNRCGGRAALMVENPAIGSVCRSSQFRRLDGSRFAVGSVPICETCGTRFTPVRHGIHTNEAAPKPVPAPRG